MCPLTSGITWIPITGCSWQKFCPPGEDMAFLGVSDSLRGFGGLQLSQFFNDLATEFFVMISACRSCFV
jgi:hypothetical protein